MTAFLRRAAGHLVRGVVMIWLITTVTFVIIRNMPGDPVAALRESLIANQGLSFEAAERRAQVMYGFAPSGSLWDQYLDYMGSLLRLDLGQSLSGLPVATQLSSAAVWTFVPILTGILLSFLVGITMGVYAAIKRSGKLGNLLTTSGSLFHAIPQFVIGLLMSAIFATVLGVLPHGEVYDIEYEPGLNAGFIGSVIEHATLPVLTYALANYGGWVLAMKSSVVTVLGDDFILAAELRGITKPMVFRYIARNAILPLFTILTMSLGLLFGGAIFVESIFNYNGLGKLLVDSIGQRDFSTMGGAFLLITSALIVANIAADLFYTVIDPRVRRSA